jgi:hypothetical protein
MILRWLWRRWPWWLIPLVATLATVAILSLAGGSADAPPFSYPVQGGR